jgi:hypothetical protein
VPNNRALGRTWVRTCLFIPTSVIVFAVLYVVTGTLVEGGHARVGNAVGLVDFGVLLVGLFFGPVWVLQAWRAPTPPGNGGSGDGDGPPSTPTPGGSHRLDVVAATSLRLPDEIDDELQSLLDRESVSSPPS